MSSPLSHNLALQDDINMGCELLRAFDGFQNAGQDRHYLGISLKIRIYQKVVVSFHVLNVEYK